jgi:hypothetical protein
MILKMQGTCTGTLLCQQPQLPLETSKNETEGLLTCDRKVAFPAAR